MSDIRAELIALRDAAERYRAEATALHAATLDRIAELEAKLAPPPKPAGLPTGEEGLWWDIRKRPQEVYAVAGHGLRCNNRDVSELHWLVDPLGHAIRCEEPDTTRVQLTGPAVRFEPHGVVVETLEAFHPIGVGFEPGVGFLEITAAHLDESVSRVRLNEALTTLLGAFAVYTTPEHAAAWRRELGVSDE